MAAIENEMRDMSLTEFLLARIAEDEAVTQDAAKYLRPGDYIDITLSMYDRESGESHNKRIRPWQPERALAECEAKRRIVDLHDGEHECVAEGRVGAVLVAPGYKYSVDPTLLLLALPYADHPDFRDEWRP